MRVYLGSDHAGFELKARLSEHLKGAGHDVVDVGALTYDPDDDYTAFWLDTACEAGTPMFISRRDERISPRILKSKRRHDSLQHPGSAQI